MSLPNHHSQDQVQFAASHRVGVQAGDYQLVTEQKLDVAGVPRGSYKASQTFTVAAERFQLNPQQIYRVFPPDQSSGDFWRDLPHIALTRSTLPWERTALRDNDDPNRNPPWLVLLVFHEDDPPPAVQTVSVQSLHRAKTEAPIYPGVPNPEPGHDEGQAQVIDVPRALLEFVLPEGTDLDYACHARRRLGFLDERQIDNASSEALWEHLLELVRRDDLPLSSGLSAANLEQPETGKWHLYDHATRHTYEIWQTDAGHAFYHLDDEKAVVIANRLPQPGKRTVMHLVSVENRYTGTLDDFSFDYQGAGPDDAIRLVSLKSWQFFCQDEKKTFKHILNGLQPSARSLYQAPPSTASSEAADYLRAGYLPLRHFFRQGERGVSWYHSPLLPSRPAASHADWLKLPARTADELLFFDQETGMFDVSYAAAWELGRMLTLQNQRIALQQYNWKRAHAHHLYSARHLIDYGYHLPTGADHRTTHPPTPGFPADVAAWFDALTLLEPVPFNYLVPEESMLPVESLRFFSVDSMWLACLRDGAFSIGRTLSLDYARDAAHDSNHDALPHLSGFLLRSEVVGGWPGLQISGYARALGSDDPRRDDSEPADVAKLPIVRMERLSKNVLLCLFEGDVQMLDVHLPPEQLHFGFDEADHNGTGTPTRVANLRKYLRDANGNQVETLLKAPQIDEGTRIVSLSQLARQLQSTLQQVDPGLARSADLSTGSNLDPAIFALEMIAGVDLVRFIRSQPDKWNNTNA